MEARADVPATGAPWATAVSPAEAQRLLQEKLARAKAMKPGDTGSSKAVNAAEFAQRRQVAEQSHAHVVLAADGEGQDDDDWAEAARREAEAARAEAVEQHESLAHVTVCDEDTPGATLEFAVVRPYKAIKSAGDLERFKKSDSYHLIKDFVLALNDSCKGKKTRDESRVPSAPCAQVVAVLGKMNGWIDEIPPIDQPMRYGNKAFRNWADRAEAEVPKLVEEMLPEALRPAAPEVWPYLLGSIGDKTRIDYGTGHEQMFICFLVVLARLTFFSKADAEVLALHVFREYLALVRRLQLTYRLEPAGSHGCWSLDDYQFLPFMWGSAQVSAGSLTLSRMHEHARAIGDGERRFTCGRDLPTAKLCI